MRSPGWYFHRFRAMDRPEVGGRIKHKIRSLVDGVFKRNWKAINLEARSSFPALPDSTKVPLELREGLEKEVSAILKRQWTAFRGLPVPVDDPPRWQYDYVARQ